MDPISCFKHLTFCSGPRGAVSSLGHAAFVKSGAWPSTRLAIVEVPAMETGRRTFLKVATLGGAAATVFGFDLKPAYAQLRELKIARATETRSTCPYCAVGCGVII